MKKIAAFLSVALLAAPLLAADDIVAALQREGFRSFSEAVAKAGVADSLRSPGPITVFAPSEAAFATMSQEERLLLMENKSDLRLFVLRHVVNGSLPTTDGPASVDSMSAEPLKIVRTGDAVTVNGLAAGGPPVVAANGVIYRIDALLPPAAPGAAVP
jgi:uncharacterized surface protein with fasciclin (FAS1) repeats